MRFTAEMLIRDALLAHPDAAAVFEKHGLPCASCMAQEMETVGDIAAAHGDPVDELLVDLNALAEGAQA